MKVASPVLRGAGRSNASGLPGPSGGPFHPGGRRRGEDRTGELLEPSLMPRKAEPRKMGRWSGVEGLAVVERQAPAGQLIQTGASTAVLGI